MGFSYRKSYKAGPFRVTASKSGISYSVGVKGARVTKRANGKVQATAYVPGTGVRYTSTAGGRATPRPTQRRSAQPRREVLAERKGTFHAPVEPVEFRGYIGSSVTLYPDRIEIRRGALRQAVGQQAVTVIPWDTVLDVEGLPPTISGGVGYIRFLTVSDRVLLADPNRRTQVKAASKRPGTIIFSNLPGGMSAYRGLVEAMNASLRPYLRDGRGRA